MHLATTKDRVHKKIRTTNRRSEGGTSRAFGKGKQKNKKGTVTNF